MVKATVAGVETVMCSRASRKGSLRRGPGSWLSREEGTAVGPELPVRQGKAD